MVEVVKEGVGELVCCGEPMKLQEPKFSDNEKFEYHVPFVTEKDNCQEIQVGEKPHPMTNDHYIEFVEVYSSDNKKIVRKYFTPEDKPVLEIPNVKEHFKCETVTLQMRNLE